MFLSGLRTERGSKMAAIYDCVEKVTQMLDTVYDRELTVHK